MQRLRKALGIVFLSSAAWYLAVAVIVPMTSGGSVFETLQNLALAAILAIAGFWIWPKPARF